MMVITRVKSQLISDIEENEKENTNERKRKYEWQNFVDENENENSIEKKYKPILRLVQMAIR